MSENAAAAPGKNRLQSAVPRVVLASSSASRRALLSGAGLRFEVVAPRVDEESVKQSMRRGSAGADATALLLAELKALRVSTSDPDALVIGADQLLVCGGEVFDKPTDLADARAQLRRLRGRRHDLILAVTCFRNGARLWHHVGHDRLTMRDFSDEVLDEYLAVEAEHVTQCVGAYRLEGLGVQLFEAIEGDYFSILGLPLLPLLGFLRQHGLLTH